MEKPLYALLALADSASVGADPAKAASALDGVQPADVKKAATAALKSGLSMAVVGNISEVGWFLRVRLCVRVCGLLSACVRRVGFTSVSGGALGVVVAFSFWCLVCSCAQWRLSRARRYDEWSCGDRRCRKHAPAFPGMTDRCALPPVTRPVALVSFRHATNFCTPVCGGCSPRLNTTSN